MKLKPAFIFLLSLSLAGCGPEDEATNTLTLISATLNGAALTNNMEQVPKEAQISMVFSSALDAERLKTELSLATTTGHEPDMEIVFSNAQSKITIAAELDFNTSYTLTLTDKGIGKNNENLETPFIVGFKTMEDETVRSLAPCTGTNDCLETMAMVDADQEAYFPFFSSYPIFTEKAEWENLRFAVIVLHGQNRDADNYFSYLTNTLSTTELQHSTVLIAPWFKDQADADTDECYWDTSEWREGRESGNSVRLSSFSILDSLIHQLGDKTRFPVMEKVIVTGHSSGALLTHVYAGANTSEGTFPELEFTYIVANSQYFYYPDDYRYNEQSSSFYQPEDCFGFNYWPLGFQNAPSYLNGVDKGAFDTQFASRKVTYLLGNGTGADGALNTSECSATLLGSSRYQRGENMYLYMNTYHEGHAQTKTIVSGIGHDGEDMYKSQTFRDLLGELLK